MTPALETATTALALLREWQSVCDATFAGHNHLLIRKGGIAEGRDGFQIRRSFFGLLPTLFHQSKTEHPEIDAPTPPSVVAIVCQLVESFSLPSLADLASLAPFHGYAPEQLNARQSYKPDRPLNVILIRAFALRAPVTIDTAKVRPVCKSWAEVDVASGLGGIDAVVPIERSSAALDDARQALRSMPAARMINVTPD